MSFSAGTLTRVSRRGRTSAPRWQSAPISAPADVRYHALDALRAAAMLLGIVLHAAISYMPCRMPHLLWAIHDSATTAWLDWLFWGIHAFRMPLFFVIAGFFSAMLMEKRGPTDFLRNRCRRILWPLVLASLTLLPVILIVWCVGWLVSGQCTSGQALRLKFRGDLQEGVYGLGHLWFLEHLFLMCLALWAWRRLHDGGNRLVRGWDRLAPWRHWIMASRFKPLWLALAGAAVVAIDPAAAVDFDQPFVPQSGRLLYYATFFVPGIWLYRHRDHLHELTVGWQIWLLLAVPVLFSMGLLLRLEINGAVSTTGRLALALDHALFAWLVSLGLMGLAVRTLTRPSKAVRYVSDASYYIYLVHMPLVAAVQIALYPLDWPPTAKFFAACIIPLALCLLSYHDLARGSWLGQLLMGRREEVSPATRRRAWLYLSLPLAVVIVAAFGVRHMGPYFFDNNVHAVLTGQAYRSAMLKTHELEELLTRLQLRTVVSLQGGHDELPWFSQQKRACFAHGTQVFPLELVEDGLPTPEQLDVLIAIIDQAPRPILFEGRFGFGRAALAGAVTKLVSGDSIESAHAEFQLRHGFCNGTPASTQNVVRAYQSWLQTTNQAHNATRFRYWAAHEYRPWLLLAADGQVRLP